MNEQDVVKGRKLMFTGWEDWVIENDAKGADAYTPAKVYEIINVLPDNGAKKYMVLSDHPGQIYFWSINQLRAVFILTPFKPAPDFSKFLRRPNISLKRNTV